LGEGKEARRRRRRKRKIDGMNVEGR